MFQEEDQEIKEMGIRWRDYPMYKIKSLELKRSDQMGSSAIDKNVNRNPNSLRHLESSNTKMHNHIILKSKTSNKDSHMQAYPFNDLPQSIPCNRWISQVTGSK